MNVGFVYLGNAAGAQIYRSGVGFTQPTPYGLEVYTWDARPLGDDGETFFRWVTTLVRHTNGYDVKITPVVDGMALAAVSFSAGPPPGSKLEEVARLRVWVRTRGNRLGVIVRTNTLLGDTELVDVEYSHVPIRTGL